MAFTVKLKLILNILFVLLTGEVMTESDKPGGRHFIHSILPRSENATHQPSSSGHERQGRNYTLMTNGLPVKSSEVYPWMVRIKEKESENTVCGGSIISPKAILTAAHCLIASDSLQNEECRGHDKLPKECIAKPEDIYLELLTHSYDISTDNHVTQLILHPKYKPPVTRDIGLIILNEKIPFSKSVGSVSLPSSDDSIGIGDTLTAIGWGKTEPHQHEDDAEENGLQEVSLTVVNHDECLKEDEDYSKVMKNALCVSGQETDQSPCYGDSGGSLVREINEIYYIFGVSSAILSLKCKPDKASIYTRVDPFIQWINKTLSEIS